MHTYYLNGNKSISNSTNIFNPVTVNAKRPNEKKEEKTMINNITSSMPKTYTAKEFKFASFNAYIAYVAFMEGKTTAAETVNTLCPIMSAYGFNITVENLANVLTVRMTSYTKNMGEKCRKIKSITTFRAFIKEGWKEVCAAPVHSNAGKAPTVKEDSKEALINRVKELESIIEQYQNALKQTNA